MKTRLLLLALCLAFVVPSVAHAQAAAEAQGKLSFLEGMWKTISENSQGQKTPGDLRYDWVMGQWWLRATFVGDTADDSVWEAQAYFRYLANEKRYVLHMFYTADAPLVYHGTWVDENTLRFEGTVPQGTIGIDYVRRPDGTVYQENWFASADSGVRQATLKTTYSHAK